MESKVNYTVVGLFVVLLSTALIIIGLWLSAARHDIQYTAFQVYVDEAVSGLNKQAPVKFNGVSVGYVSNVEINPHNLQQVILTLMVEDDIPITITTVATLKSTGLTGMTYVGLTAHSAKAPLLKAKPGQNYPVIPSTPSLLVRVSDAVRDATENLNSITEKFQEVFSYKNTQAFEQTLENIDKFTQSLSDNSQNIDASLKSMRTLLANSANASKNLPKITERLDTTLNYIESTAHRLSNASTAVSETMRASSDAIKTLKQQAIPSSISTLQEIENMSSNIESLSKELKRDPSMLLRGKKHARLGPGEK